MLAGAILCNDVGTKLEDRPPILRDHFRPGPKTHLLKIDPSEADTQNEMINAPTD